MTDRKLDEAGRIPGLSLEELVEAREAFFGERQGIPYDEFIQKTQASYQPIDFEEYARAQNFVDALRLLQFMSEMRQNAERLMTPLERSNHLLMLGCGQGRLLEVYVPAARLLGIESITLNDLIPAHVEQARAKAKDLFGRKLQDAGVKLDFVTGDFLTAAFHRRYDQIISFWYVSAELLNPESELALRQHRTAIYRKLHETLVPNGTLFEDIPDPNQPGYYDIATHVTKHVLQERGLMGKSSANLLLSNWKHEQDANQGFPYQLRYVPRNGADQNEKDAAGFAYVRTEHENVPASSLVGTGLVQSALDERGATIENVVSVLRQMLSIRTVTYPDSSDPAIKRRKMTLWRAERTP